MLLHVQKKYYQIIFCNYLCSYFTCRRAKKRVNMSILFRSDIFNFSKVRFSSFYFRFKKRINIIPQALVWKDDEKTDDHSRCMSAFQTQRTNSCSIFFFSVENHFLLLGGCFRSLKWKKVKTLAYRLNLKNCIKMKLNVKRM